MSGKCRADLQLHRFPECLSQGPVSTCVINEHGSYNVEGAYHQLRRFRFIKSYPWCADTGLMEDRGLSLQVLLTLISFAAIVCAAIT